MKFTAGPWRFDVNPASKYVRLEQATSLGDTVLMFERWGMQGATPLLRDECGIMRPAHEFAKPFPHRPHHADWARFIDHPDARLIECAPELRDACVDMLSALRRIRRSDMDDAAVDAMQAAVRVLGKVEGGPK